MQLLHVTDGLSMAYHLDDFTDPWQPAETVLFLHGNAESGEAWYAWVPHFGRHFRVLRPDMRGFGSSTPMPADYAWSLERLVADFVALLDHLALDGVHVVAAKIGAMVGLALAALHPERVLTLTVIGAPASGRSLAAATPPSDTLEQHGVEAWARFNMASRLGSALPPEAHEWWARFMGRTPVSSQIGFVRDIGIFDVQALLGRIAAPTLVITTEGSGIASVAATRAWQQEIAGSELLVLPGNSYHAAVSDADQAAECTLDFIRRRHTGVGGNKNGY